MIEELAQALHRASVRRAPQDLRPLWEDLTAEVQDAYRTRAEDLIAELNLEYEDDGVLRRLVSEWVDIDG